MPGNNHYDDCTCGWCWKTSSSDATDNWPRWDRGPRWPSLRASFDTYTDPNARCPVCGEAVFFYRSPYDGRVFFDELGPPWPKHPCTDTQRGAVQKFVPATNHRQTQYQWQLLGWEPVILEEIKKVKDWALLKLRPIASGKGGYIMRVMPWRDDIAVGLPTHIKPLDAFGIGRISILRITPHGEVILKAILAHRVFSACEYQVLKKARKDAPDSVAQIAEATYKSWEIAQEGGVIRYPAFVDFRIAKNWLAKSLALGSREAEAVLSTQRFRGI